MVEGISTTALGIIVAIFLAWSAVMLGIIKLLIERALSASNDRHKRLQVRMDTLENDFRNLLVDLPNKYVQREDWIRLATTIEAKMDALNNKFDELKDRLYARN
ncbi:hypothetical protein [uncultured Kiloniella sp.]|uniref:hypothetical protein n=1 Tax=uncultured Kiloniella sp. TaxID=1133091 RepID=UPI0026019D73|nr:hypothetical protein [uncultured Kiloniella sp.]